MCKVKYTDMLCKVNYAAYQLMASEGGSCFYHAMASTLTCIFVAIGRRCALLWALLSLHIDVCFPMKTPAKKLPSSAAEAAHSIPPRKKCVTLYLLNRSFLTPMICSKSKYSVRCCVLSRWTGIRLLAPQWKFWPVTRPTRL